jgi:hypothetical protein
MADRNVNIVLTATDLTGKAVSSATSGIASLSKLAVGAAAGFALFNGVGAIFGGISKAVFGMNNSLDATGRQAATMLESIRTSTASAGSAITATTKQTENWGRQLREIREREAQGFEDFARKTKDLNDELADLLGGRNIQKRARDEQQALDDLAKDHADRVADLQQQITDAQNEGLLVDGVLYRQANEKKVVDLQRRIEKEDRDHQDQLHRRRREYDEDLDELQQTNNRRIAEVRRALEETKRDEVRFTRDIKEAYADLETAKRTALSAGGGGGGLAEGRRAVITYREELQKLGRTGSQIFTDFQKFFREEGVRSPFNVADIQAAGAQLAQFSGGNLRNMQQIVRMAEALASSPAVQQYAASERLQLGIRALSEAYNGQFESLREIFNIAGPTFDALREGTFTTTQFTDKLNASLESAGVNYALVEANSNTLEGAWGNLVETGNLLLATVGSPIYDAFRNKLVELNVWVTRNQGSILAFAETLRVQLGDFIRTNIIPALDDLGRRFVAWVESPRFKTDLAYILRTLQETGSAIATIAIAGARTIMFFKDLYDIAKPVLDLFNQIQRVNPLNPYNDLNKALFEGLKRITGRASGGPITAGTPYLVGERGPELVVPRQSGTVIPAHQTSTLLQSGGPTVHIDNFHAYNDIDLTAFARELSWRIN